MLAYIKQSNITLESRYKNMQSEDVYNLPSNFITVSVLFYVFTYADIWYTQITHSNIIVMTMEQ